MESIPKREHLQGRLLIFVGLLLLVIVLATCYIFSYTYVENSNCSSKVSDAATWTPSSECLPSLSMLISAIPDNRGRVRKEGVLPLSLWLTSTDNVYMKKLTQQIETNEIEYVNNSLFQKGKVVQNDLHFPPSESCAVFVNHKYKIIFVNDPSQAGLKVWEYFGEVCNEYTNGSHCLYKANLEQIPLETAEQIWSEYTVFTTISNPFNRAATSYKYLLDKRSAQNKTQRKEPGFQLFSQFPFIFGIQSRQFNNTEDMQHDFYYVERQTRCLLTANGKSVVDFIVSKENIVEDLEQLIQVFVQRNNTQKNQDFFRILSAGLNDLKLDAIDTNQRDYVLQTFKQCGLTCLEFLRDYYYKDLKFLGYPTCVHHV
eukprot:TRINITY_DN5688_c1_g1_i4.p1 TRINITY_DN5688_c1_g1~~TRINITY_DN5688_c1_g1_i4.p1  ORF type:complete len:371 (+),score=15.82 TRINITY_DN5688_c1_g1_i4:157-1269(+)